METFSSLLAICVPGEFPTQRQVMRSFDVFFYLRSNKRLSKQYKAGNLRRHRAHYDVTIIICVCFECHWERYIISTYTCDFNFLAQK